MDAPRLKKALDSLYGAFLPKGTYPWVYLRFVECLQAPYWYLC